MTRGQVLAVIVLTHLVISVLHGQAHTGAQVPLPIAGALFVYIVILAGPIVGLTVARWRPRAGSLIVAGCMFGALVFGLVNHFMIEGQDHVAHVAVEWRTLFGTTAVLLAVSEVMGVAAGVWAGARAEGRS